MAFNVVIFDNFDAVKLVSSQLVWVPPGAKAPSSPLKTFPSIYLNNLLQKSKKYINNYNNFNNWNKTKLVSDAPSVG